VIGRDAWNSSQDVRGSRRELDDINAFVGTGRAISDSAGRAQKSLWELREYFRGLLAQGGPTHNLNLITALASAEDQAPLQ